jgi:hypothetical protein
MALLLAPLVLCARPARGAPDSEVILYESHGLRIIRTLAADGTPVTLLTNVDADGNLLSGPVTPEITPGSARGGAAAVAPAGDGAGGITAGVGPVPGARGGAGRAGNVTVVVNGGDHPGALDEPDVQVTSDGSGGTTVIVNIGPPPATIQEPVILPPPSSYPVVTGGIVGGYRYPDHLYFLGYAPGISSPSWFGGLGLNSGNGFGLSNGNHCTRGFDCTFGPTVRHASQEPHSGTTRP